MMYNQFYNKVQNVMCLVRIQLIWHMSVCQAPCAGKGLSKETAATCTQALQI